MIRKVTATMAAGLWVGAMEFLRNELLFKAYWTSHYAGMGLVFPSSPVNDAVWGVWSLLLAACVVFLTGRLRFGEILAVVWVTAFAMMWAVTANLAVLPTGLLPVAVPWSLVEVAGAAWIAGRILLRGEARSPCAT